MNIYETSKEGNRLKEIQPVISKDKDIKHEKIEIKDTIDQTMLGFGGAFTESSAYNLMRVGKEVRKALIKAYFDPIEGIGYNLGRISINSSDFGLRTYDYVAPYDETLASFDISRDQEIIDLILDAQEILGKPINVLASPWSPPFWMKDNLSAVKGGKLLPKYRKLWATYIVKFVLAYKEKGIHINRLTIQNEPLANQRWESCIYDHEEEKLMVIALGEALKEAGLNTEIYIWDHNRDVMYERSLHILSDEKANQYVTGIAFHWYDRDHFLEVKKTHDAFPNKTLLFTEGCQEGGPHLHSYDVAERYGLNMMKDIHHGTTGYIDWNLFLDTTGGPNHVNNLCSSPVMVDVFPELMIKNPSYYYIAHFSKFVKHQAKRLETISEGDVLHNAFISEDKNVTMILLNLKSIEVLVSFIYQGNTYETIMSPHSIQTIIL
jgi:glucosylceramidase